jgi:hypothetical protein
MFFFRKIPLSLSSFVEIIIASTSIFVNTICILFQSILTSYYVLSELSDYLPVFYALPQTLELPESSSHNMWFLAATQSFRRGMLPRLTCVFILYSS